jgi:hypothetical protein
MQELTPGGVRYRARELTKLGHEARRLSPSQVKPVVLRGISGGSTEVDKTARRQTTMHGALREKHTRLDRSSVKLV